MFLLLRTGDGKMCQQKQYNKAHQEAFIVFTALIMHGISITTPNGTLKTTTGIQNTIIKIICLTLNSFIRIKPTQNPVYDASGIKPPSAEMPSF